MKRTLNVHLHLGISTFVDDDNSGAGVTPELELVLEYLQNWSFSDSRAGVSIGVTPELELE